MHTSSKPSRALLLPAPGLMRCVVAAAALAALLPAGAAAQAEGALAEQIRGIVGRPEYRHARWGMEFYSLRNRKVLYALNEHQLFLPGSTGKIYPQATLLAELGPDHRFRTRIYRTGPVSDGTLDGDLVLVATGDPNLSNRLQPDGTLAFRHPDHSYAQVPGAGPLPGDPLLPLRSLARQVAARGIRQVTGRVLVDAALFPERPWLPQAAVFIVSPIVINDNIVDITLAPGKTPGAPGVLRVSPETRYVRFINETRTAAGGAPAPIRFTSDVTNPDGTHTVTVRGTVAMGSQALYQAYFVREPTRFAQAALVEALTDAGVDAATDLLATPDFAALTASYTTDRQVAEHVSAPLSEAVKVTLKLSHNLHASMTLDLLGATVGGDSRNPVAAGLGVQRRLIEHAGLDLSAAVQNEGAGTSSVFTADFAVRFLEYVARQPYARAFHEALPVMGRDGSLVETQVHSPAAGRVRAKTGTGAMPNLLGGNLLLEAKALAGYIDTPADTVAFAAYVNYVPVTDLAFVLSEAGPGEAIGEIVTAVYRSLAGTTRHRTR